MAVTNSIASYGPFMHCTQHIMEPFAHPALVNRSGPNGPWKWPVQPITFSPADEPGMLMPLLNQAGDLLSQQLSGVGASDPSINYAHGLSHRAATPHS